MRVGDVSQHYRTYGDGPALLLLHGLTNTWRVWRPYIEELGSTHALIVPDLRGHGDTPNPASTLTPVQVAQDMIGLLDSLDVTQVRVIGYSFGGHVALRMAALQPERVEAMVVIAGAHRLLGSSTQWHDEALGAPIPRGWWIDEVATWHPGGEDQVAEVWSQGLRGALAPEFAMSDSELSAIRARALIIQGDNDEIFPLDVPLDLSERMPNAQLWIIPNTTHDAVFWMDVAPPGTDFGGGKYAAEIFAGVVNSFFAAGRQ